MTKYPIIEIKKKRALIYRGFVIFRAKPNGGPYLKHEAKWWKGINGCMIQFRNTRITFLFRRRSLKG
ncbi:hypothetical protein GCM10018783_73950 [Streptomyces griseosporeus]|nr:hypothetical protein GCM10018783_73950 [Streptomyces griseosporeus]